ncbi:MAG: 16S rRNA methyltransferase, partial [Ignisphaera sp.]
MLLDYDVGVLEAIKRVYGELYKAFLGSISRPGSRIYARVNVLRTGVGEVIDSLRARGIAVYQDEELEEAVYFPVEGPFNIEMHGYDKVIVA